MATLPLDLPISFFEFDHKRNAFANVPSQQTTLRRIVTTKYYKAPVEAIRCEPDKAKQDEMKKQQPAITPVALLRHRKANTTSEEKVIHQWPMLMGDIDKKDNPNIDMAELKKHMMRLPFVLLCAYSVRGGLWFIVHLPPNQTPESLAAHFRYLERLFSKKFLIKLDSTKGGKSTDLRFVSYDAEPYLNDNATVMEGTYTPPPPKRKEFDYSQGYKEDEGLLLKRLVSYTERAGEGDRHETLLKAAKTAGGFVAAGRMDEQTATLALETAASEWPQFAKSQKTIRDGIRYGLTAPIYPEERTYQPSTTPRQAKPKPTVFPKLVSRYKITPDEVLTVDPCDTYPPEWDQYNEVATHFVSLIPSIRRDEFASLIGINPSQLPLYQLKSTYRN